VVDVHQRLSEAWGTNVDGCGLFSHQVTSGARKLWGLLSNNCTAEQPSCSSIEPCRSSKCGHSCSFVDLSESDSIYIRIDDEVSPCSWRTQPKRISIPALINQR
jgi:hypothetical protein